MPYADSDYERSWKMQTKGVTLYPVKPKVGPTPGPWTMGPCDWLISQESGMGYRNFPIRGPEGYDVAMVYCDEDDHEQACNVCLIEAAPDMLATLRRMREVFEQLSDGDWRHMDATYVDQLIESDGLLGCDRAIAKAEGRSE